MEDTRYLAMFKDATGLPRAWAVAPDRIDAEASAKLELEAYRDEHSDRQEPFTLTVKILTVVI